MHHTRCMLPEHFLSLVPLPLLEVAHVAHRLRLSHEQVRRLIRDGQLKAIRLGTRWRVDEKDLEAFIDAHRKYPTTPEDRTQALRQPHAVSR